MPYNSGQRFALTSAYALDDSVKMKRKLIQSILSLPTLCLAPWSWIYILIGHSPSTESMLRDSDPDRTTLSVMTPVLYYVISSAIGLFALFYCITSEPKEIEGRKKWISVLGLTTGLLLFGYILVGLPETMKYSNLTDWLFMLWILFGPAIAAAWCLIDLLKSYKKIPNKSVQTTSASARV